MTGADRDVDDVTETVAGEFVAHMLADMPALTVLDDSVADAAATLAHGGT